MKILQFRRHLSSKVMPYTTSSNTSTLWTRGHLYSKVMSSKRPGKPLLRHNWSVATRERGGHYHLIFIGSIYVLYGNIYNPRLGQHAYHVSIENITRVYAVLPPSHSKWYIFWVVTLSSLSLTLSSLQLTHKTTLRKSRAKLEMLNLEWDEGSIILCVKWRENKVTWRIK